MKKTMRKLLALMMSFLMLFGSLPVNVIAEGITNLLPNVDDSFVVETGAADDATDDENYAARGDDLPIQENSGSFSLAGNYDIMPLAANDISVQPQTSRYSATGWADASTGIVFAGDTTYMRYRVKRSTTGETGPIRVVIKKYEDGVCVDEDVTINSVSASGDSLSKASEGGYNININK